MKEVDPRAWQQTVRTRALLVAALFAVWAVAIEGRLVSLQIFQHEAMLAKAKAQKDREDILNPRRGDIVDRHGRILAMSVDTKSICAVPNDVEHPEELADAVCWALGDCTAEERDRFVAQLPRKKGFAFLRRQVTLEDAVRSNMSWSSRWASPARHLRNASALGRGRVKTTA